MGFSEHNKSIFDAHTAEYVAARYWREDEEILVTKYFTRKGATMLVAGVGGGRVLEPLLGSGFAVTAIDIAPRMVAETKKVYGNRATIAEGDIQRSSFGDETFMYIFLPFHTLCYVDDVEETLAELRRIVDRNGVVIVSVLNNFYARFITSGSVFRGKDRLVPVHRTAGADSVWTHHFSFSDRKKFKKYFSQVEVFGRSQLHISPPANWKEWLLRKMPWFDKSLYFVLRP